MKNLQVGDTIQDNDPRMAPRLLIITELLADRVVAKDASGREFRYLRARVFADGKLRRTGFSKLPLTTTGERT